MIWIFLIFLLSKRATLASNSFLRSELKAIAELHEERANEISNSNFYSISIQHHLENILSLDPLKMLEEMLEISEYDEGIASFWLHLDIFKVSNNNHLARFKEELNPEDANLIVMNFKKWVIHVLLSEIHIKQTIKRKKKQK